MVVYQLNPRTKLEVKNTANGKKLYLRIHSLVVQLFFQLRWFVFRSFKWFENNLRCLIFGIKVGCSWCENETLLSRLEGSSFKNFLPLRPSHGRPSGDTTYDGYVENNRPKDKKFISTTTSGLKNLILWYRSAEGVE